MVGQPAGMQPAPPLQYYQPTPVPRQQVVVTLPTFIRPGHRNYFLIFSPICNDSGTIQSTLQQMFFYWTKSSQY